MPVEKTGMFSGLVLDYLKGSADLRSLYSFPVSMEGVRNAIEARKAFSTNRELLHEVLCEWYEGNSSPAQQQQIESLLSEQTFTVCTAHQCNIFSGYLYFVYKILHVIRIAETLNQEMPDHHFVPVYYMGSEDNDLDELGQFKVDGVKYVWNTTQTGAVGRMKVDKPFLQLITQLEGQLGIQPHGQEVITMLRHCYQEGVTIAKATFDLVNKLFREYGLLVIMADDARLKAGLKGIMTNDLFQNDPERLVKQTGEELEKRYKVQVNPRQINLFYMTDGSRERIVKEKDNWRVDNTNISFSETALRTELDLHPERFSPNVVLRALYQEMILPDIAFVGGGAEIAYWMELQAMFQHFHIPFPMLVLRNSFLIHSTVQEEKLTGFGLSMEEVFLSEHDLMTRYVSRHSANDLSVTEEQEKAEALFSAFKSKAAVIDSTLVQHLQALETKFQKQITEAGKKLLRAEKRKFEVQKVKLKKLKNQLFPGGTLQERYENILPFYTQYGPAFIDHLYQHSPAFEQQFILFSIEP